MHGSSALRVGPGKRRPAVPGVKSRTRLPAEPSESGREETPGEDPTEVGFGPHLVFDGAGCPCERLDDLGRLYTLLDELPDRIHMTKIMPPYVFRHGTAGQPGQGISGFVLIAESHISVHTFPRHRHVNVDIFSCEHFDAEDAVAALRQAFQPRWVKWKLYDRGLEFPKHLGRSRDLVTRERQAVSRSLGLEVQR